LAIVALCAPAAAEDAPLRKAGLWEIATATAGETPPQVVRMCIDDATERALAAKAKKTVSEICSRAETHREGADKFVQDSVCNMGSKQTMHSVMTIKSDSEYSSVATSHFDPPFMGATDQSTTQTARWLGPCGPDMSPGDAMVDGRKINGLFRP
jgi:hypothetical protein